MITKAAKQVQDIAGRMDRDCREVQRLLWEIQRLAIERGNCRNIWNLAKKALRLL